MTAAWSESGISIVSRFGNLVGEVSILLVRFFSLRRNVDALARFRTNLSGDTFCGVGSRRGDDKVSPLFSVTGEPACRRLSNLAIAEVLFPISITALCGDLGKASS